MHLTKWRNLLACDWKIARFTPNVSDLGETCDTLCMHGIQLTWIGVVDPTKPGGDVVESQEDAAIKRVQPNKHKKYLAQICTEEVDTRT